MNHGKSSVAGRFDRDAVRDGRGDRRRRQYPGLLGPGHRVGPCRLDADHPHLRRQRLDRGRHPGDQSAAADRHDDCRQFRQLAQYLQSDRSLSGHDLRVIEGMDKGQPLLLLQLFGLGKCFVIGSAGQHNFRPIAAGRAHFRQRRRFRHHDDGADTGMTGRIGHPLRVIACRSGDNAAFFLRLAQ